MDMENSKVIFLSRRKKEALAPYLSIAPDGIDLSLVSPDAPEDTVIQALSEAKVIITYDSGKITEKMLMPARNLKLIQTLSQGTNHIPMHFALEKGIYVCNIGGANALSVAEHALLLTLAVMRVLLPANKGICEGGWRSKTNPEKTHELYGKTVGVIGFGAIGSHYAKIVHSLGTKVIYFKRTPAPEAECAASGATYCKDLRELLKKADVISLHVPLTQSTRGMIGWEELKLMKPTAYFINTARGEVVDEPALIRALNEGIIAGAGLDVFAKEPTPGDNPLLHMNNVVATPHTGSTAWENLARRAVTVWDNTVRVVEGRKPLHIETEY